MSEKFYSNGKLLLTGEYAILDGAKSLALPTKFGQSLKVLPSNGNLLHWKSFNEKNEPWFEALIAIPSFELKQSSNQEVAEKLVQVLTAARNLNPDFLSSALGFDIETKLDFPSNWGLGSSSTLINNIAQWAQVDAHQLLWNSFGGSGYDISCAQYDNPIVYQLDAGKPAIQEINFNPLFKDRLFFVHLNKKQDSRQAIANYRKQLFNKSALISNITSITEKILSTEYLEAFESLLIEHESLLSKVLAVEPVKQRFPDYFGVIKSLGAWGGDFVLATGNEKTPDYFKDKGFNTILSYKQMVLNS